MINRIERKVSTTQAKFFRPSFDRSNEIGFILQVTFLSAASLTTPKPELDLLANLAAVFLATPKLGGQK
jgi:hypothetical protein